MCDYVEKVDVILNYVMVEMCDECCEVNVEGKWVRGQRGLCFCQSLRSSNDHNHVSPKR